MDSVPMPRDLSEEAVAAWLGCAYSEAGMYVGPYGVEGRLAMARAVLALVRAKVRETVEVALAMARNQGTYGVDHDDVIASVMGEEAPRA